MLVKSLLCGVNRHINMLVFVAQNVPNSDWEKKVTEYFKEKLKENNATNWVRMFYSFRVRLFFKYHCYLHFIAVACFWLVLPFHDKCAAGFQAQALGCGIYTSSALTWVQRQDVRSQLEQPIHPSPCLQLPPAPRPSLLGAATL